MLQGFLILIKTLSDLGLRLIRLTAGLLYCFLALKQHFLGVHIINAHFLFCLKNAINIQFLPQNYVNRLWLTFFRGLRILGLT